MRYYCRSVYGGWDPAVNGFILRWNSCWRTNKHVRTIRTSREKLLLWRVFDYLRSMS